MKKAWAVLGAVYLASIVVVINQFKVVPVMQVLMEQLHVDMTTASWLMSIFALAGLILAIPAAVILGRYGPKRSGLFGLGCTICGCAIGGLATDPTMLLFGRVIEGVGMGLFGVVAPAVIAMSFPPQQVGLPMGIWATWVPVGSSIAYNIALPLQTSFGWRGLWWFGAALGLIAFIVYGLVITSPSKTADTGISREERNNPPVSYAEGFKTPGVWLLAFAFFALTVCVMGYATWAPSYFSQALGISAGAANFYTSLMFLMYIPGSLAAGWLQTRIKNRNLVLITAFTLSTLIFPLGFRLNPAVIVPYIVMAGLIPSFITPAIFTLAPESMRTPALGGLAMGIVMLGQNAGTMAGPPMLASIVKTSGSAVGSYPLLIVMVLGIIACLAFAAKKTKKTDAAIHA